MPLLLLAMHGYAQMMLKYTVGEVGVFEVKPLSGTTFCWNVAETIQLEKGAETAKVSFLTSKCNSRVRIRWEQAGTYYLSVNSFNQNGCSNCQIFRVNIFDNHIPVANNDYVSCNWQNSIRVDLLGNDYDAFNDLDTASLKILTKAEFGEVKIGPNGTVIYSPLHNQTGTDKFYYQICDACNQCDTAMVSIEISNPPLFLPQGISPNGDGINDRFVIMGLDAFPKSSLTVFSRDGVIVYQDNDYKNDWDGNPGKDKIKFLPVPSGTYYYLLHPGGTNRVIKGFVYIAK